MTQKKHEGLRYNNGKLMYDLIEPYQLEALAGVNTKGAEKYTKYNWCKGQAWSTMLASMKRHIAAFEKGEDYDPESGNLHMAHAAWNALAIVSFYRIYPQGDDRLAFKNHTRRIGLDVDEVVCGFVQAYCKRFNLEIPSHWNLDPMFKERMEELEHDKDFWLSLEPLIKPEELPFEPAAYITARPINNEWTIEWLHKNGFPIAPVITTTSIENKLGHIRELQLDFFIDDNYSTYAHLNKNGACCFLMDAKHNRRYNVGYRRIKDLHDFAKRFL